MQETINQEYDYNYVKDGLAVYYDAENNTGNGHSDTATIWKDLSGNENDATLNVATPTWETNCYNFANGSAQYFESKNNLQLGISDRTIEFVVSTGNNSKPQNLFGFGSSSNWCLTDCLIYGGGFNYHAHGNSANEGISEGITLNKIYSNTWRYTNSRMSYRTNNTVKNNVSFYYLNTSTSKFFIGKGVHPYNSNYPFKIYAIRIYDRLLTDEEIKQNYEIDKYRFGITQ